MGGAFAFPEHDSFGMPSLSWDTGRRRVLSVLSLWRRQHGGRVSSEGWSQDQGNGASGHRRYLSRETASFGKLWPGVPSMSLREPRGTETRVSSAWGYPRERRNDLKYFYHFILPISFPLHTTRRPATFFPLVILGMFTLEMRQIKEADDIFF